MTYKYGVAEDATDEEHTDSFSRTVLANANRGGENVATGALIGALAGASCGYSRLPEKLLAGLAVNSQREQLDREVGAFVANSPLVLAAAETEPQLDCKI